MSSTSLNMSERTLTKHRGVVRTGITPFNLFGLPVELQHAIIEQFADRVLSFQRPGCIPPSGLGILAQSSRSLHNLVTPILFKNLVLDSSLFPVTTTSNGDEGLMKKLKAKGLVQSYLSYARDVYIVFNLPPTLSTSSSSSGQSRKKFETWFRCITLIIQQISREAKRVHFFLQGAKASEVDVVYLSENLGIRLAQVLIDLPHLSALELNIESPPSHSNGSTMIDNTLLSLQASEMVTSNLETLVINQSYIPLSSVSHMSLFSNLSSLTLHFQYLFLELENAADTVNFPKLRYLALISNTNYYLPTNTLSGLLRTCASTLHTFLLEARVDFHDSNKYLSSLSFPKLKIVQLRSSILKEGLLDFLKPLGQWEVEDLRFGSQVEIRKPFGEEKFRRAMKGWIQTQVLLTISKDMEEGMWSCLKRMVF